MISFEDYLQAIGKRRDYYPNWRAGQAAFNTLREFKPELANYIQFETNLDPHYLISDNTRDRLKLKTFFEYVRNNWENNDSKQN